MAMKTKESYSVALAVLFACSDPSLAAVNIIDQTYGVGAGSFELGAYSQNSGNADNYMRLTNGSTTITGWTVGGPDGIDWMSTPSHSGYDGIHSIDLSGASYFASIGSVTTIIPTAVGVAYDISFVAYIYGPDPVTGVVTAGNLNQEFSPGSTLDTINPPWTAFQYSFVALSNSTDITFITYNGGGFGPVIDNVVVAIPEPSSALLCVVFGLGLLTKRSRPQNRRG
jgi:hypothetical protein